MTLGGVITHGASILEYYRHGFVNEFRRLGLGLKDSYETVLEYIPERYFGGNLTLFKHIKQHFIHDYGIVSGGIDYYINASNNGRNVPVQSLLAFLLN